MTTSFNKLNISCKVHESLAKLRYQVLQAMPKPTGSNPFQKFDYFQLSDFLPIVIQKAQDLHLSYVESFGQQEATLTVIDIQSGSTVTVTIPIDYTQLKGGSPMQSIGASVTYARRYLWVSMIGLTDNDLLDKMDLKESTVEKKPKTSKPSNDVMAKLQAIQKQNAEKRSDADDS